MVYDVEHNMVCCSGCGMLAKMWDVSQDVGQDARCWIS